MSETENENQNTEETAGEIPAEAEAVEAAVEPEAAAETPAEEPVAEAPTETAEEAPTAEPAAAAEPPAGEAASQRGPKKKKKRLPRAQRRQRTKPARERPAERKPITRIPKGESERGRRQERRGVVVSNAMDKTIVVKVDTIKAHTKYKKVVRRSVKFHAHDPENQANVGDIVRIIETRPISKTKNWRVAPPLRAGRRHHRRDGQAGCAAGCRQEGRGRPGRRRQDEEAVRPQRRDDDRVRRERGRDHRRPAKPARHAHLRPGREGVAREELHENRLACTGGVVNEKCCPFFIWLVCRIASLARS